MVIKMIYAEIEPANDVFPLMTPAPRFWACTDSNSIGPFYTRDAASAAAERLGWSMFFVTQSDDAEMEAA